MDPLTQQLMQRALGQQGQPAVPPNAPTKIPQADKRFANAQAIQDAYRNGWAPNPMLLRVQLGHK
jgi:hypothetical protein